MMARADYLYSGESASLAVFYDDLRVKTLQDLARADGVVSLHSSHCTQEYEKRLHLHGDTYVFDHGLRDLVGWPPGDTPCVAHSASISRTGASAAESATW